MRDLRKIPYNLVGMVIVVFVAAILLASVEYNFITLDGLPYREAQQPLLGPLYPYHFAIILLLGLLCFQPFINEALRRTNAEQGLKMTFALGMGSLMLGILLEDSVWFVLRVFAPLPSDPLAHQWIRASDHTALVIGHVSLFGLIVPLWYMILIPPTVAIFLAFLVSPKPR